MDFVFTYDHKEKYFRLVDFVIGEIFRKYMEQGWIVTDLNSPSKSPTIYKGVKNLLIDILVEYNLKEDDFWKNLSPKAVIEIDQMIKNFELVWNRHLSYFKKFLIENDNNTQDQIPGYFALDKLIPAHIRPILRITPKAIFDPSTSIVEMLIDEDGIPIMANEGHLWMTLKGLCSSEMSFAQWKQFLTSKEFRRGVPEIEFLIKVLKIEKSESDLSIFERKQVTKFYELLVEIGPSESSIEMDSKNWQNFLLSQNFKLSKIKQEGFLKVLRIDESFSTKL